MATRSPTTIITLTINGATEFNIPFEFLARRFVVVTLIGSSVRQVLTLGTDYRFVTSTKIQLIMPVDETTFPRIELRRHTSTTDRLVTFVDGSILRATDLNLAQVQTMHVAEEARDLTSDSIGVNDNGDLDARSRRIINLANGTDNFDAVNLGQLRQFDTSTGTNADKAESARIAAEAARDAANTHKERAAAAESVSVAAAGTANQAAMDARISYESIIPLEASSRTSAAQALVSERNALTNSETAKREADRAQSAASSIGGATYAQIRAYNGSSTMLYCVGRTSTDASGAGHFEVTLSDTTSLDNDGTVLIDALNRRWKRTYTGPVDVTWFGAQGNNNPLFDNTAAFSAALVHGKVVYVPGGYYHFLGTLSLHSGQYIIGDANIPAPFDGGGLTGAARLIFNGAGATCIQSDPAQVAENTHYCGLSNLAIQTTERDYVMDMVNLLQFTMEGVRLENRKANGAAFRSVRLNGVLMSHNNAVYRCQFSSPNGGTRPNFEVDWSDSMVSLCDLSGGAGAVDIGPGNIKWIGNQIELGSTGLTIKTKTAVAGADKPATIIGNTFDINTGFDLVLDASLNTSGMFSPTVTGNSFRSDTSSVAPSYILLKNDGNTVAPVMKGGVFSGNTFTSNNRSAFTVNTATWGQFVFDGNICGAEYTPFTRDADTKMYFSGPEGLNIPENGAIIRGRGAFRGLGNTVMFAGHSRIAGSAGVALGVWDGLNPFVGATLNSAGASTDLFFVTDNAIRMVLTASGANFKPQSDNFMALGAPGSRYSQLYAGTGTINTSDGREKRDINKLSTAERNVALKLKSLIRTFRFNDAVAEKGSAARIHTGVIAQDVVRAFQSEGLNPFEYAIICHDAWDETQEGGEKVVKERFGIRYDELMAFIISAM